MVTITLWFTLGTLGMLAGTLVLAYGRTLLPDAEKRRFWLVVAVPAIALVAYALMALGVGGVSTGRSVVYVPRYVDWLLTTPIHVAYLGLLAGAARSVVYRAAGLQAATIVFGLAGAFLSFPLNLVLWVAGAVVFGAVVWLVYNDYEAAALETQDDAMVDLFRKLRAFVVVLWLVYPAIWLLAPAGFGLMDVETASLVVSYIDVVAKVGFGLIVVNDLRIMHSVEDVDAGAAAAD